MDDVKYPEALSLFNFPAMLRAFAHPEGGFHERLSPDRTPLKVGQRRVLSQARMIFVAARIGQLSGDQSLIQQAIAAADHMREHWAAPNKGTYFFARFDDGGHDETLDLYAHAFVVFAFSWLAKLSGEERFADYAHETIDFVQSEMASPEGGFVESIDGELLPRRQNPHMHLLEALLAMLRHNQDRDGRVKAMAEALIDLALTKWIQPDKTLREYFTQDWQPDPKRGQIVEVGHHFEWAWLFCEAAELLGRSPLRDEARGLYAMGQLIGCDHEFGGYYDEVSPAAQFIKDTKRIWVLGEAIKAGMKLGDDRAERDFDFMAEHYADKGWWREHLDRRLAPINLNFAATTPYHLLFALTEYAGV